MQHHRSVSRISLVIDGIENGIEISDAIRKGKTIGIYDDLGIVRVAVFVVGDTMFVSWNGRVHAVGPDRDTHHAADGNRRTLLLRFGERSYKTAYTTEAPVSTQFYSEDEEDADFGLWLHNILSSDKMIQHIKNMWKEGI